MNILVFGKDGQLGKAFKEALEIYNIEKLHRIYYAGRAECDLVNSMAVSELLNQVKPDLLINAGAYTAVDKAETEVDLAYAINAKAPEVMAMYAKHHGATFLHYSTDYVFDGTKEAPYTESDARNPLGIYGKSKAAGEEAIEETFANLSVSSSARYGVLRTSWLYGDGGNFIRTILRLAKERETLKVVVNQYGTPTSADWLVQVSLALVLDERRQLKSFPSGIYHAVPLGETTWHALASFVVQVAIDAGAALKLHPDAIEAISAADDPLLAPRPMNSRMTGGALQAVLTNSLGGSSNVTKSHLLQQSWEQQVATYVQDLALQKRI
jgi:dTDP-4-dehydrorhamnose reductase